MLLIAAGQQSNVCEPRLAQAILFKPLLLTHRERFTVELLLLLAFLRPRQPCHGAQGMVFDGRSHRVGPDCARATTKVGEVATCEASWEWFGAEWASGPLAFLKRSPRSSLNTSSRPRRGAGGSKPTGFKAGSCVARNGRLRRTRGSNIEIFFAEGQSCFTEQTDPGSNRGDRSIHFPSPEASVMEEERVREQELLDKALLRQERLRRELQIQREELPCAVPDVSAQLQRLEATVAELRKERDDLRQKVEGRSGVWMANKRPDVDRVAPIPVQEQHIYDWLSSRNCELRNALELGDHSTISKLSSLLAEGCGRLAAFGTTESMDTSSGSDLMAALITDGDAKRRCLLVKAALPSMIGKQVS